MSTINSLLCGLSICKNKTKRKTILNNENTNNSASEKNKNNHSEQNHMKEYLNTEDDKKLNQTNSNQPFLSKPLKFFSINFLYKNPIGRQFTRENLRGSEILRAVNNPKLMIDPQQAEYVKSIPNALSWRGLLLQGYLVSAKALEQIERFPIQKDDVWLVTYPKSGTTWTEEILSLIVTDANVKKTNSTILPERVPHLEVGPPIGYMKWLKNRPSPRVIATHLPIGHIPQQLRQCKAKIIYVVRNPKDNAVSYYHHHRMSTFLGKYNGTWNNFVQLFANGQLVYGDWFEHVRGYWEFSRQNPDNVLFISYEELKINLPKMIRIIAEFIEHPLTQEQIDVIARQCTFEKMKNNAMVNREKLPVGDLFDMSETKFMRKGIIGDWKNYFTEEEDRLFEETYTERLNEIGLKIAYDYDQALEIYGENVNSDQFENNTDPSATGSSGFSESSELSESLN